MPMYQAVLNHTLEAVVEYSEYVFAPMPPDATIIDRMAVTDVEDVLKRKREIKIQH